MMRKIYLFMQFALLLFCLSCSRKDDWKNNASVNNDIEPPTKKSALGQFLGVTVGFQYSSQLTGPPTYPDMQNISLYNPDSAEPNLTWESWAEQLEQAGVDFICPNLTGSQPVTNGSPVNMAPMVAAINNRGLTNKIKFAAFDDNAASWTAQWNEANGRGYGYAQKFDMSDPNNWKYIYDYNYKLFYQTVPDANRFKINGRPVIIIWTGNTVTFLTNMVGNASQAIMYVRQKCQADFGFNPYIILSGDFFTNDPTCNNPGVADAREDWFGAPGPSYSLASMNGVSIGVAVPQFWNPSKPNIYINPNHGQTFENGLAGTVGAGALLTLCEGFTDYEEDAAMWRVRNIATNGSSLNYSQTGYDFPNQRLNILRKYSSAPFPALIKFEAEGCDSYGGAAGGNGKVNYYRNGNIAIEKTTDALGGHNVGWIQNGQWFQWEQLPFSGSPHLLLRIATPNTGVQVKVEVDGVAQPTKTIPSTGGWQTYTTYDYGSLGTFTNSYHKVRVTFPTGGVNFNWIQLSTTISGVTFYSDTNYGGAASQVLPVGNYTLSQLAARGMPNDWASSVRVPAGRTVIMYSDDNFTGQSWTRTSDTPNFPGLSPSPNDAVSSVKVQ